MDELSPQISPDSFSSFKKAVSEVSGNFTLSFTSPPAKSFYCFAEKSGDVINIAGVPMTDHSSADSQDEVLQLKKEMEEFAYIASHDLQEPLRKVSTYVERLMDKLPEEEKANLSIYTDRITVSLNNMRNLIDDLLQFSRSAKQPQTIENINFNDLLNRTIIDNELKIEESRAKVFLQPLPKAEGDAAQMLQVFNNLITNALKFVRKDEAPVIYIYSEQLNDTNKRKLRGGDAEYIKITVRDEGIGFDKQFENKIFQMFQRLNPKHSYSGSGIGLAICKKIITNHNGFITAESDGKSGSAFSVVLPKKQQRNA